MRHQDTFLDLSPKLSDRTAKTTCYMCACRCGINVHLKDGRVAYIEGNRDHPVNKGVLCAKGAAGIMQVTAPSRLRAPLRRVGPRGSGQFEEISWDEALETATAWMAPLRATAPEKLAFFTGRDQSQSLTGWWAQQFGTPNYAAHGGFCSVNMAAAGIYTMGGAFWEFGQPDWERTKLLLLFGVAEDHDSNPIKMGLGKLKERGARVIGINPIRTGYNAVADDWIAITPGTDGLLILSLIHCLLTAGKIDLDYLARYTNAPVLVNEDPASPEHGLFLRDDAGKPLVMDRATGKPMACAARASPIAPCSSFWPNVISTHPTHPRLWRNAAASPPPASMRWPPSLPAWPLTRRSRLISLGQIFAANGMKRCWAAPSPCMRCAASRPIPTAFRPRARCTCYKSCSALLRRPVASASSPPIPNRLRRIPSRMPPPPPANRSRARIWAIRWAPSIWRLPPMARPSASTRRFHGKTHSRRMA